MKLRFKPPGYKSIEASPIDELPPFAIITGPNGAGKTQFLEAIAQGHIAIEGVDRSGIRSLRWDNVVPPAETPLDPRSVSDEMAEDIAQLRELQDALSSVLRDEDSADRARQVRAQSLRRLLDAYRRRLDAEMTTSLNEALRSVHNAAENRPRLAEVARRVGVHVMDLTADQLRENYAAVLAPTDAFSGNLLRWIAGYFAIVDSAARTFFERLESSDPAERVGDALAKFNAERARLAGEPPWELANAALAASGLRCKISPPDNRPGAKLAVRLISGSGSDLSWTDLSSGEQILAGIALSVFSLNNPRQPGKPPSLLLLDEVDALLHPSMCAGLLRLLQQEFVEKRGVPVLLATHSPSTVALAPTDAIYLMDADRHTLSRVSQDAAIAALAADIPTLSVRLENRRQVYVENGNDVAYWERITRCIKKAKQRPELARDEITPIFLQTGTTARQDATGCDRVRDIVADLRKNGVTTVTGIIDWDLKNKPSIGVTVNGQDRRYSIENYLLDPLALAAFMLKHKAKFPRYARNRFGLQENENYWQLVGMSADRLQAVANAMLKAMGWTQAPDVSCSYLCGATILLPRAFVEFNGHELQDKVHAAMDEINSFIKDVVDLKLVMLEHVFDELPLLLSADLAETLDVICSPRSA